MLEFIQFIDNIDISILDFVKNDMRSGILDVIMPVISAIGNSGLIWIIIAIIFICLKKYRAMGISLGIALILCLLIGNLGLKPLIARIRPYDVIPDIVLLIPPPKDYSFPSGHTMASFASATVIFWYHKRFGICALILGSAIAFSRLYLYVHYPTDILGGVVIGIIIGVAAVLLVSAIRRKVKK